jgi:hypothetical protein
MIIYDVKTKINFPWTIHEIHAQIIDNNPERGGGGGIELVMLTINKAEMTNENPLEWIKELSQNSQ